MTHTLLKKAFWLTLLLTLLTLAGLGLIDGGIKTTASPSGIVSFELCAYGDRCGTMLQAWSPHARDLALLSLGIDYLFMLLYPGVICLGLMLVHGKVPHALKPVTHTFAWLIWLAGLADAIENYGLIQMVLARAPHAWAWPASIAASIKFAILAPALLWLIFLFLAYSRRPRVHPAPSTHSTESCPP